MKGGAAVANQRFDLFTTDTGIGLAQAERTRWGGTVGVGFEYGFAPNWSAALEYDYLWRVSDSNTFLPPGLAPAVTSITANTRSDVSMVTARINYRFSWSSPAGRREILISPSSILRTWPTETPAIFVGQGAT